MLVTLISAGQPGKASGDLRKVLFRQNPLSRPQISGPSGFLAVIAILIVHK